MWSKRSLFQIVMCGLALHFVNMPSTWAEADIEVPRSPCPDIFKYKYDGKHFYGYGQLTNLRTGEDIVLIVNLIIPVEFTTTYPPTLEVLGSLEEIVQKIYWDKLVNFKITFPTQNPLPLILSIVANDNVICENSETDSSEKSLETEWEHFSNFELTTTINNFTVGCGKIPKLLTALVFGGTTINKGDWPWLAAIHHYDSGSYKFRCGGTIISRTTILSAAHCFYTGKRRITPENVIIFLGHHNLRHLQETGSKIVNVESIITHSDFKPDGKLFSDIAIVKFAETVEFSEFIQPACLWSENSDINDIVGQIGAIVGWGKDENGHETTPEPKRVQMPIVSEVNCIRSHEVFVKRTNDNTFCGGWRNGTEGPCQGDSGSGMLLNRNGIWYIRGVVSFALADHVRISCDLNEYVVFTDVARFSSWIESNMT